MKKLLAVIAVVAFCASFTSCKKDCVCSWKGDDVPEELKMEMKVGQLSKSDCENKLPEMTMEGATYSCVSK